jgi:hypothetical protein
MRASILLLVVLCAVGCTAASPGESGAPTRASPESASAPVNGSTSSSAKTTQPTSPLPSGGISKDRAIDLARGHTSFTMLVAAIAGSFGDLNTDGQIGPGYPIKPDHFVWAVEFSGDMTICNPLGVCESPRPGTLTVFLDYSTGDFLSTLGQSPAQ